MLLEKKWKWQDNPVLSNFAFSQFFSGQEESQQGCLVLLGKSSEQMRLRKVNWDVLENQDHPVTFKVRKIYI